MRVSAAGNMPLQGLVKPPAKPVVMISRAGVTGVWTNLSGVRIEGHRKIFEGFGNDLGDSSV